VNADVTKTFVEPKQKPRPELKPFMLPPKSADNERVIAYLQRRGIAKPLILDCISRGLIYQSAQWNNCVFVGYDTNGKARYASMRGTIGDFKRDVEGSNKQFGFLLPAKNGNCDTTAAFESPVDALSHQMLFPNLDIWRLSLGSTALTALTYFLEQHGGVKFVIACTDNDQAGNKAAARIAELQGIIVTRSLPSVGKDWSDTLNSILENSKQSLIGRLETAKQISAELNAFNSQRGINHKRNTYEWRL
jgi:hypothetical protein